jgi:lysophospholipase L1-like esterase
MSWIENGIGSSEFVCSKEKKNIFLIGDSIRRGYCNSAKNALSDLAEVFFVNDNCRSSQYIIFSLRSWSQKFDDPSLVDLIYFNCGHWDAARWNGCPLPLTSVEEYGRNIDIIIWQLRHFFPNAKLIFATTSPANPNGRQDTNPRTNAEIDRYNEIAKAVCQKQGITVHDMNADMKKLDSSCFEDSVHLTREAFEDLGKYVAAYLKERIKEI